MIQRKECMYGVGITGDLFFDIPHLRKQARKLPLVVGNHCRRLHFRVIDLYFCVMVVSSPPGLGPLVIICYKTTINAQQTTKR